MQSYIITADQYHIDLAFRELRHANDSARKRSILADGIWLVSAKGDIRLGSPIFLRHIAPAQEAVTLAGTADDITALKRVVRQELAEQFPTSLSFSVQTRILADVGYKPFDINRALSTAVEQSSGAALDVRSPEMVLSVTIAEMGGETVGLLGASDVGFNLHDWAGGERRFRREKGQISRAEFKLLEAIEYFGLELPAQGVALDLGAAPGGWTRVLRQAHDALVVVAVDPGELHPSLRADWGVNHVRGTAEWYLETLTAEQQFDVIVNDMRLDARDSADLLTQFAPHLAPDGFAIMTAKLPQHDPLPRLNHTLQILKNRYNLRGVRQLFHNRREVTIWAVNSE